MNEYTEFIKDQIVQIRKLHPKVSKRILKNKIMDALSKVRPWTNEELEQWEECVAELLQNYDNSKSSPARKINKLKN